jgi:deazaflavin-dependent oxidoreductase (nitroreductase family)
MASQARTPPKIIVKAFIALHIFVYRLSGGRIWGRFGRAPVFILTVKGRKSGRLLSIPLCYVTTDRGYAVIASFGGAPTHPTWYLNLAAASTAAIEIGRKKMSVRPEIVAYDSDLYRRLWEQAVAIYPDYETYKQRTTRPIPIVELVLTTSA